MSETPERPERPLLPTSLWALLVSIAVMRSALAAGIDSAVLVCGGALVLLACAPATFFLARRGGWGWASAAVAIAASCALASFACAFELEGQRALARSLSSSPVSAWELSVESDMSEGVSGWRARARVWRRGGGPSGEVWLLAEEPLDLGTRLRCVGRFTASGDDEWGAISRAQGLCGTIRAVRVTERGGAEGVWGAVVGARSAALDLLDAGSSDGRALVAGAVCGSTRGMAERGLDVLFAECGISHLVAVSGGHLVLVAGIASRLLSRLRLRPLLRAVVLLAITGAFVAFCGAPDSAVRSWVMSLVAELSGIVGRRGHPLSSAAVVGLGMALVEPGVTGRLGYLLSVSCVCGICALGPYASYALRVLLVPSRRVELPRACCQALGSIGPTALEALSMTLVSQLVTAPMTCSTFGTLSLVAPLANVLLGPIFSLLLVLGMLAVGLSGVPCVGDVALLPCEAVSAPLVAIARGLASIPGASVVVSVDEGAALAALAVALVALLLTWPRLTRPRLLVPTGALCAVTLGIFLSQRYLAPACVRVLDVGQADAILVTDGGAAVLVDTGLGEEVLDALARNNVVHLDAVVLTHLHEDHVGGLEAVLDTYGVKTVYVAEGVSVEAGDADVVQLALGDELSVGRFSLCVVSPGTPVEGDENEDSLVMGLNYNDGGRTLTALLTGDAESDVVGEVVAGGLVGDIDLLKVGHHGSEVSVTPELARALDPEVSVASAGEGNSYGHPDPTCVEMLEDSGSLFLCTKDVGDVCVEPGGEGPVVSLQRGGALG